MTLEKLCTTRTYRQINGKDTVRQINPALMRESRTVRQKQSEEKSKQE